MVRQFKNCGDLEQGLSKEGKHLFPY